MPQCVTLASAKALFNFAYRYGLTLKGEETILLQGPMGAGKTLFVQGVASAFGVDAGEVLSPSYALLHQYSGRVPIMHLDLYRLSSSEEFELIGAHDYLGRRLTFIEWPQMIIADLNVPYTLINISISATLQRIITFNNNKEL
jgi:tRNA threonylcarbamoyladenosine biosynthesis protein TsaE